MPVMSFSNLMAKQVPDFKEILLKTWKKWAIKCCKDKEGSTLKIAVEGKEPQATYPASWAENQTGSVEKAEPRTIKSAVAAQNTGGVYGLQLLYTTLQWWILVILTHFFVCLHYTYIVLCVCLNLQDIQHRKWTLNAKHKLWDYDVPKQFCSHKISMPFH